ncbi:adenylate/guanylate cyclase domain-containing protein [Jeotgalibacillus terrae]|uniref:Adenylate/guanylate cyclase domain-containing protein n=1 Tax=Jeotgalibacillus terrae TaxID=587735 RepID=A0ABW5ZG83_9BACL|nr:adenylate/guanylate cyclase domain-containing protein [Jeotgalibacillus terrae]MBM7579251.1 class 3 adenylate cyclase [Jeotgalibacillus terrae]
MKEKQYVFKKIYPVSRQKAWELLANTEHLNRVSGLFPVDFSDTAFDDKKIFRYANAKAMGLIPLKWREYPFEWVKEEVYAVERKYESGPIKRLLWEVAFKDSAELLEDGTFGTEITGTAVFTPANLLGLAAIPSVGLSSIKEIMKYLDKYIEANLNSRYEKLPAASSPKVEDKRLKALCGKISAIYQKNEHIERLQEHLTTAGDDEVMHMKPYTLADQWGYPRKEILTLFLTSVKEGLLTQEWHLMCPNCRVSKTTASSMKEIKDQVHCDLCGIDYEMSFDRYIEMQFSVHPSVRQAADQTFCLMGPAKSPHVLAQLRIPAGQEAVLRYPPATGKTRIRLLKHNASMDGIGLSENHTYRFNGETWSNKYANVDPEGGELTLMNDAEEEMIAVYETLDWNSQSVTAAELTSLQLYRDLFSAEVLAPDQQIGIQSMTVLFSDLKASTALYEKEGDAKAYFQVSEHFRYLKIHISEAGGTIVKTIGDAVMAVFFREEDALSAALNIQSGVGKFNEDQQIHLSVKLGLHTGPVIAVNANDLLDYFGRTVNIAARIQQQSTGDDVVITQEAFERLEANLSDYHFVMSRNTAMLAGSDALYPLVNIHEISRRQILKEEETVR